MENAEDKKLCKLTGCHGKFVDSHLIPRALTRPAQPGMPFIQAGDGIRPTRRWDSWYDSELVIRKGEDVLSNLDDWAITELRKHKLIWTGWGGSILPANMLDLIPGGTEGFRNISGIEPKRFRLFFLSLLWRAAATTRPEFSNIVLPAEDLQQLRKLLLADDPGSPDFYPAQIIQIYTKGEIQNHTPILQTKTVSAYDGSPEREIPIIRFYFDGLVVHIHRQASDEGYTANQGSLTVGHSDELIVGAVTYETSFQRHLLMQIKKQAATTWPNVLEKLTRPKA